MHELPLVFFTVFAQTAVGAFVFLLIAGKLGLITERQRNIGLFASMCLFGLGVLISSAHLGQPLRAFNVLSGIGRSAMSNETALIALFGITGGLSSLGLVLNKGSKTVLNTLAIIAAICGAALVIVIPMVYKLDTVAAWNTHYTTLYMILTAFVAGGAFACIFGAARIGALISAAAIALSFALKSGWITTLQTANSSLATEQTSLFTTQSILLVFGLIVALTLFAKDVNNKGLAYACAGSLIVAELLSRIAFYNMWAIPM